MISSPKTVKATLDFGVGILSSFLRKNARLLSNFNIIHYIDFPNQCCYDDIKKCISAGNKEITFMKKIAQLGFIFGIIGAVTGAAGIVLGAIGMVKNRR